MTDRFNYDVFLSHNSQDKPRVRKLAKRLKQAGLRVWFVERWAENDRHAYRASLKSVVGWDVEARLGEIQCPVLVVASDEDYLPLEEKRAYTARKPRARLVVIEDARHAVTVEKPEEFNAVVGEFFEEVAERLGIEE
jgi:3-oxoadipate enol-lactonase